MVFCPNYVIMFYKRLVLDCILYSAYFEVSYLCTVTNISLFYIYREVNDNSNNNRYCLQQITTNATFRNIISVQMSFQYFVLKYLFLTWIFSDDSGLKIWSVFNIFHNLKGSSYMFWPWTLLILLSNSKLASLN